MDRGAALGPAVWATIRHAAFRAGRVLGRHGFEREDIEQDLVLHYLRVHHTYDASRGAATTFVAQVCRTRINRIAEAATAAKRGSGIRIESLFAQAPTRDRTATTAVIDTLAADACEIRAGLRSQPAADELLLCIDVDRAIRRLPPDLAAIARLLADGAPPIEIAHILRVSRATLYRRIARLREALREAGLAHYGRAEAA